MAKIPGLLQQATDIWELQVTEAKANPVHYGPG